VCKAGWMGQHQRRAILAVPLPDRPRCFHLLEPKDVGFFCG
jgi:hypothetical protein